MTKRRLAGGLFLVVCLVILSAGFPAARASLMLRVSPAVAMVPARITVFAELKDVSDDDPEYYCPVLEWEWGDGSISERKEDCAPFEKGKTKITRRFMAQHQYKRGGSYEITLRLKRGDKTLTSGSANVEVMGGSSALLP